MKMLLRRRFVIIVVIIIVCNIILVGSLWRGILPNPILIVTLDFGSVLALLAILTLAGWGGFSWTQSQNQHQMRDDFEQERRTFEDQLKADRRRFLQRLNHEFKNPLTTIRAAITNLRVLSHPSISQSTLDTIENETVRLSAFVTDLRKLADLEVCPLEKTKITIEDLLQEVVESAGEQPEARTRHLTLHPFPQAPGPLPQILGDYGLLFLAIYNLLSNALKFTQPGDKIEVRAYDDGARIRIEVADTGIGIPPTEISHVWEELYRGQEARTTPGSGLGLAMVKIIVERHDGHVELRSPMSQGTVVTILIPATT